MKKVISEWRNFLNIFLSPWFIFTGLSTILAIVFSIEYKDNQLFSNLLTILGSITGGLAGGIFQNEYSKNLGQEILEKKGQSAVRNLQSIQKQINNLKDWVVGFLKKSTSESKSQLEEIYRHVLTMELCIDSGYEDWIDIVPQLSREKEVKEKINEKYQGVYSSLFNELLEERMKLYQSANAGERDELGKKISQLEKQIKAINNDNSRIISGSTIGINRIFTDSIDTDGSSIFFNANDFSNKPIDNCNIKETFNGLKR